MLSCWRCISAVVVLSGDDLLRQADVVEKLTHTAEWVSTRQGDEKEG